MGEEVKLRPCPFCGGEVYLYEDEININIMSVKVNDCIFCDNNFGRYSKRHKDIIIKKWNTRSVNEKDIYFFTDEDFIEDND